MLKSAVWSLNCLLIGRVQPPRALAEKEEIGRDSKISVIIPCYNEAGSVAATLASIGSDENVEVIVSDGGSGDETVKICQSFNTRLISGGSSRAECMNKGAAQSSGQILLFLHADSELPKNWAHEVRTSMEQPRTLLGCFEFRPVSVALQNSTALRLITRLTNMRSRYFNLPYGDQGLFLRRGVFTAYGGFPALPFMEDFELVDRIRRSGDADAVHTLGVEMRTSARRWETQGVIRNSLVNQAIVLGRQWGVPHNRLVGWYYGLTKRKTY
jgi:rSAM/selenodomain-associated transferase 2